MDRPIEMTLDEGAALAPDGLSRHATTLQSATTVSTRPFMLAFMLAFMRAHV
jgi:hypothetical protein